MRILVILNVGVAVVNLVAAIYSQDFHWISASLSAVFGWTLVLSYVV